MSFGEILLLAVGLAMDATAVAAARGVVLPTLRLRHAVRVALYFGGAQALMPLLGWFLGAQLGGFVQAWDHWIAFVLLFGLGAKMLWETLGDADEDDRAVASDADVDPMGHKVLALLAVATSLDALAVGVTLPLLEAPLVQALVVIGVVTAALSALGLYAGRRFGALLGKRLDAVGGLVLIGLGVKVLVEHLR